MCKSDHFGSFDFACRGCRLTDVRRPFATIAGTPAPLDLDSGGEWIRTTDLLENFLSDK